MNLDQFAWNCFCNSGSVEAFLLYKQEEALMSQEKGGADCYEFSENGGDCPSGNQVQ